MKRLFIITTVKAQLFSATQKTVTIQIVPIWAIR